MNKVQLDSLKYIQLETVQQLFLINSTIFPTMQETSKEQTKSISSNISQDDSSLDRSFQSCANSYDFCVHFINKADNSVDSQFVNAEDNLTLEQCMIILQDRMKRAMNELVIKDKIEADPLPLTTLLSEFVHGSDTDLYVYYQGIKPIIKQIQKDIHYQSITKYSYLDQKKFVKVYIPLDNIGSLPADKIVPRFLDRSVQIRIHDYLGKNWIFAIPKTQCHVLTKISKVSQKENKLIVYLGKMAQSDNWFSLHKTKCIGEKDD